MNAILTGADGFLARYADLRDHLPGDLHARDEAAKAFRRAGLPGRRVEAWKYTDLRPIASGAFHEPLDQHTDCAALLARAPHIDGARLVFVDGRFRNDLSTLPAAARFTRFADDPSFGALARPEREQMVALNTMLAEDGAGIEVPENTDAGLIHLVSLATDTPHGAADFHPRHRIRLAPGATLTVLETSLGDGTYLHAPVTELHVAEGASLTHIRLQDESTAAFHLSTLYAEIAARGTYDSFALNLGGRMARTEVHARLTGPGAITHLNGAQLLSGTQHADFTTVVRHDAPHGTSRQTVKNVLAGRSRGVFQGRIEVARQAQKTDGYQMSQSLLLSPDAEIDTKPELEIFADDVKCSHGATVGELDAEQLFYLRSRGIPDTEARSMLVRAFLAEALDAVTHETARAVLEAAVEGWWQRQAA
ncbi:MAG TPA: Fe-S cluster assembly protein SufD [Acetobacteraceae bacterium]|jgi:Fe-S cluster assembly protein SufD|nr:Fe-S cluster assembly protein SufD [Acetobacteraceae bacterium]